MQNLLSPLKFITPDWDAPSWVRAKVTTRHGGVSSVPYDTFNLATHVGDLPAAVFQNRQRLCQALDLPTEPAWLDQQHTTQCVYLTQQVNDLVTPLADASWTDVPQAICVVMTADCLPILVTNRAGSLVAAIHAGWKGLAAGIVENTIQQLPEKPENLMAWIGPAIGPNAFEVGQDVFEAFTHQDSNAASFFSAKPSVAGEVKFWADLPGLAKLRLNALGVSQVSGGHLCSYALAEDFYSYRRDGQTGRMASLIWIEPRPL